MRRLEDSYLCLEGKLDEVEIDNKNYASTVITIYNGLETVLEIEVISNLEEEPEVVVLDS